jgi:acyl dehydratase
MIDAATVAVGDCYEMLVAEGLTRTQIVMYAGASGDFHPFHHDETHAREHGFPSIFAHGMLTMGLAGRLLSDLVGDASISAYAAEMRRQVWPGDSLTASAVVTGVHSTEDGTKVELKLETSDQDGEVVLTGTASATI